MTPIQQILLGVGAKKKTYMDDVFSTYVYKGTGSARSINNAINLSGEGGMTWFKRRDGAYSHRLVDTVRGVTKGINSNTDNYEVAESDGLTAFNNNGFSLGSDNDYNGGSGETYASWSFRKTKGFFDVVTYTGNGTARTIAHSLGSVPGMIMIKNLDSAENWRVYHKSLGATNRLILNSNNAAGTTSTPFNDTAPTASVFSVGTDGATNNNGDEFVAYLFAGGESEAATARGVRFDGSDDYLSLGASSDFDMGTGDFTIECWINRDDTSNNNVWTLGSYQNGMELYIDDEDKIKVYGNNGGGSGWLIQSAANALSPGTWHHIAVVRDSGTLKLFQNGTLLGSTSHSSAMPNNNEVTDFFIGLEVSSDNSIPGSNPYFDGEISNFRIVKGTAVYTSSFRPPTEPLTNITNTKLLCCNNSSTTGSTVTPGTITANSSPTASTDSPFDDPAAFTFGENGDQGIIKCGSYVGNGTSTGPEINVGWEPQWLLIKRTSDTEDWMIFDSMRGLVTNGGDTDLRANATGDEGSGTYDWLDLTSTGFKITCTANHLNGVNDDYVYIAIRRSDGYVGKPADAGTDVFAMDTGADVTTIPNYDSGFPVDFSITRPPASADNWHTAARLTGNKYLRTNATNAESSNSGYTFDSNVGWATDGEDNTYQSWMFKRHAGFDVVTYKGNGTAGHIISHSLSKTPEMIWVKNRTEAFDWIVGHKGLDGGTNPWDYHVYLNATNAEVDSNTRWNDTAPTSTHVTLGTSGECNQNNNDYVMMLFASVNGISKVGSFTNSGGTTTVSCGFQPRFVIVKCSGSSGNWYVYDTVRGINAGGEPTMNLNDDSASTTHTADDIDINSDGFTIPTSSSNIGFSDTHIFYAHA